MNIFVAKLSFNVNDDDLNQLFAEYGEVSSARVVIDRTSGRSKGFGFVEMTNNESAQKAIKELNNCEFDGRVIVVSEARPKEERPYSQNNSRGNYGSEGAKRY